MIWLTWRQFRIQTAVVFALVGAVAITVAITGPRLFDLARIDANIYDQLTKTDRNLFFAGIVLMAVAPIVIGVFWGAPMVARELETGTHRLVWNQTVTRTRWLATKLGIGALAAAAGVGLLSWAVTWWSSPIDGALSSTHGGLPARITPVAFAMRGVAPAGFAVFVLVLGVTVGMVLRRTLPAMALTLALSVFVAIAMPLWVRPHLIPPEQKTVAVSRATMDGLQISPGDRVHFTARPVSQGDWVLSNETVDSIGRAAALPSWVGSCFPPPPGARARATAQAPDMDACFTRLTAEGYRQHLVYQPADRFWPLQWAETALYLALSGLLAGFCFWWIRRRVS